MDYPISDQLFKWLLISSIVNDGRMVSHISWLKMSHNKCIRSKVIFFRFGFNWSRKITVDDKTGRHYSYNRRRKTYLIESTKTWTYYSRVNSTRFEHQTLSNPTPTDWPSPRTYCWWIMNPCFRIKSKQISTNLNLEPKLKTDWIDSKS